MRYWKFSQKTKLKQKFFANSEKEVGNFFQGWDHSVRHISRMSFFFVMRLPLTRNALIWEEERWPLKSLQNIFSSVSAARQSFLSLSISS